MEKRSDIPHYFVLWSDKKDGRPRRSTFVAYSDAFDYITENLLTGARIEKSYTHEKDLS